MFLRNFSKVLLHGSECPLIKFKVNRFWNSQFGVLPLTRSSSVVVSHPTVTSDYGPGELKSERNLPPYFLQYFLNNSDTYYTVNTNNINWDDTRFQSLKLLMHYKDRSQETQYLEELQDCLEKEVDTYDLEDIYKFIFLISKERYDKNALRLFKLFSDKLCKRKFSIADTLKILFFSRSCWPNIIKNASFGFSFKSALRLCSKIKKLSLQEVPQLFFCLPPLHKESQRHIKFAVQEYLVENIPQFNTDELGLIAEAFLRSKFTMSNCELLNVVMTKASEEIKNMHCVPLYFICKLIETHIKPINAEALLNFQEKVIPHISNYSKQNLVSLAMTGSGIRYINPLLWKAVATDFKNDSKNFNVKHMERIAYAMTVYNIHDDELLNLAVKECEAREDILKEPKHLIFFLNHLIYHKLYPEKLLGLILTKNFYENNLELLGFEAKNKYFFINTHLKFDNAKHSFTVLDFEERRLNKVFTLSLATCKLSRECHCIVQRATTLLKTFYGDSSVCLTKCLPHYDSGIIMRFDRKLKAQTIPQEFISCEKYAKEALSDDHFWLYITVVQPSDFLYKSETPILPVQTKIRALEDLGYKLVLVSCSKGFSENNAVFPPLDGWP